MKGIDLVKAAVGNTLRSKTRTSLTVVAIVIGAFTLTLTSGVGTGINAYIDRTVASIGAGDVMTVTKTADQPTDRNAPQVYDPEVGRVAAGAAAAPGSEVEAITPRDLETLSRVAGVVSVEPTLTVRPDFVRFETKTPYRATVGTFVPGMTLDLAAGAQPTWNATERQVAIPVSYVRPLGFANAQAALGKTVTFGVTGADGQARTVDATVVGVVEAGLAAGAGLSPNDSLTDALYDAQSIGLTDTAKTNYASAVVRFDSDATTSEVTALKDRFTAIGYTGTTVADQIGAFRTVIDAIVLVLNGFAIIALLAAGFGIVNTLLMSVQERTREIGLMKAMGMPGGRVFGLFSAEAVFIGLLGSAIGAGLAILTGSLANTLLAGNLLSALPGLSIVGFNPLAIGGIVLTVMVIAFLAGTIPALRAARQDPIDALRYE